MSSLDAGRNRVFTRGSKDGVEFTPIITSFTVVSNRFDKFANLQTHWPLLQTHSPLLQTHSPPFVNALATFANRLTTFVNALATCRQWRVELVAADGADVFVMLMAGAAVDKAGWGNIESAPLERYVDRDRPTVL